MKTREGRNGGRLNVWEPGESGNPAGSKPGYKQARTVLKELLAANGKFLNPFTGEMQEMTMGDALHLMQIFKAASEGDTRAYETLMDRVEGKPAQPIDHSGIPQQAPQQVLVTIAYRHPNATTSDESDQKPRSAARPKKSKG